MTPLEYALKKAREAPYISGQYRLFACVLDKKNRIVAESHNSYVCTHPKQFKIAKRLGKPLKTYLHAEMAAIIKSKNKGCKLVVARVTSDGQAANAKPCCICEEAIRLHGGIKSIEYSV